MDRIVIRGQMPSLIADHIPRNCRQFRFRFVDGNPSESVLGFLVDPQPFKGRIIAVTEEAVVVKLARAEFAAVDRSLIDGLQPLGTDVLITPYARRHFDGTRVDTPVKESRRTDDGVEYTVSLTRIGGGSAPLPLPKARCPQLADFIEQLEQLPAPDGFRCISHLLVDAGAHGFSCVDPDPKDILSTPPTIQCSVATGKFEGELKLVYDRGLDAYLISLHKAGIEVERVEEVYFDDLGNQLERLIDDGRWRRIQMEPVLKSALAS